MAIADTTTSATTTGTNGENTNAANGESTNGGKIAETATTIGVGDTGTDGPFTTGRVQALDITKPHPRRTIRSTHIGRGKQLQLTKSGAVRSSILDPSAPVLLNAYIVLPPRRPAKRLITNNTRNTMKQILAMPAEAAAMPPNPRTAAIIATTKNTQAYHSINLYLLAAYMKQLVCQNFSSHQFQSGTTVSVNPGITYKCCPEDYLEP